MDSCDFTFRKTIQGREKCCRNLTPETNGKREKNKSCPTKEHTENKHDNDKINNSKIRMTKRYSIPVTVKIN